MRRDPNIVRRERPIKPRNPLLLRHLPKAIHHARIRQLPIRALTLLLQSRLHKIEWQTHCAGEESCYGRCGEGLCFGVHGCALETRLGFGEEGELAEVERHGADDGGGRAGPEADDTFVFYDAA